MQPQADSPKTADSPDTSATPTDGSSLVERARKLHAQREAEGQEPPEPSSVGDAPSSSSDEQPKHAHPEKIPEKRSWGRILFTVLLFGLLSVGFWQRQNLIDWWALRNYTPTVDATRLATEGTMTDKARKIFYLQKPLVQDKATFYKSCEEGETSIVLGCYKPTRTLNCKGGSIVTKVVGCGNDQGGIFVLKVDDQRLNGVEQVTAAHEMLHAAYGRLSYSEERRVANMLNNAYASVTDQNVKDKIAEYKKSGADITNELHSILGTEVAKLPSDLEEYYRQYFQNRATITKFASDYQAEFKKRKDKVDALDKQLKDLETQIDNNNKELDSQQAVITAESKRLDALLKAGQIDEYNAGVGNYNKSLVPFRALIAQTKQLVADYRSVLSERNKVAAEAQELEKALDSRITPSVENI